MGGPQSELGSTNAVCALIAWNDGLNVGGSFTAAGGRGGGEPDCVLGWHDLVTAIKRPRRHCVCFASVGSGNVYTGGSFIKNAGVGNVNRIARWDGTEWSALGTSLDTDAYVLIVYNGALHVGGECSTGNCMCSKGWAGYSYDVCGYYGASCTACTASATAPKAWQAPAPAKTDLAALYVLIVSHLCAPTWTGAICTERASGGPGTAASRSS